MIIDTSSEPGAWAREIAARGTHGPRVLRIYHCAACGWSGDTPSITDASSERELPDGTLEIDRTHLLVCPTCFALLQKEVRR